MVWTSRDKNAAKRAVAWAEELARRSDWLILDLETTGLGPEAEPVEIGVLRGTGQVLFNSCVRPRGRVHEEARHLHGFSDQELAKAPPFDRVAAPLRRILHGREVVAYHADFDRRILWAAFSLVGQPAPRCRWSCLCDRLEAVTRARLSLGEAAARANIEVERPHRALPDAATARHLILALAGLTEARLREGTDSL